MKTTPGGYSPLIALERNTGKPLHRQIYDTFRATIIGRNLQPGQQIPSSRALAAELGISRIPVLNAYAQLLAEGYFESRRGSGTFVSSALPEQLMSCVSGGKAAIPKSSSLSTDLERVGFEGAPWILGSGAFSVGQLAFDHFPFQVWSNLVARRARKVRASALNYSEPMGDLRFRKTIAMYLKTSRAVHCEAEQIMVVSGSQQALDLSARVLLSPGNSVWLEEPGYKLTRSVLMMAGCQLIPVPVDNEGIDVAAAIKLCRNASAAYVTPSHQFPLGVMMSASRRIQLLDWAHNSGAWIIEDDYDSEYRYESMPVASLQGMDRGSRVLYIGTFSKTLFPSLRLGYLVLPPELVERFITVRRLVDLCPPYFNQAVLADFMEQGHFARHIRKTRMIYGERRSALVEAIRNDLGDTVQILGSEAGMHLAITLGPGLSDYDISVRAAERGLWLWPLSPSYIGEASRHGFILGFGSTSAGDMPQKIRQLKELLIAATNR